MCSSSLSQYVAINLLSLSFKCGDLISNFATTYTPKQNFLLYNEMNGDTINVFIETVFNSYVGNREVIEDQLKIIVQ